MLDYCLKNMENPLDDITVDMGEDRPLVDFVIKAISGLQIINLLRLYPIDKNENTPFVVIGNWDWNPHPLSGDVQTKRRETGTKLKTKTISDNRIGVLKFDTYVEARDKNKNLVKSMIRNTLFIPISDNKGRYYLDSLRYSDYQLVDKLLYPGGENSFTIKSLLPVVISYEKSMAVAIDGEVVTAKVGMVKIFTTMEPILACFMHVPAVLSYLEVFPILQFTDHVCDDQDEYMYFKPNEEIDGVYIKAYRKGLDKFEYTRTILIMAVHLIKNYKPRNLQELNDPTWWVYQLSYYDGMVEHRGACHQMHVARMLDTISAQVLPIPEVDKRVMITLLKYVLQTEFDDMNFFSFENKRLRRNEVISTIITAMVSDKLKQMFRFGALANMADIEGYFKFAPDAILKKMYDLGTVHSIDFANDLDYPHLLSYTRKGPNSLGRLDHHKISRIHRQMNPSMIGKVDFIESSKDVGQSGTISPYADVSVFSDVNVNKYPNIKFDLYKFIEQEFPQKAVKFHAKDIVEYNQILDYIIMKTYTGINFDYHLKPKTAETEAQTK